MNRETRYLLRVLSVVDKIVCWRDARTKLDSFLRPDLYCFLHRDNKADLYRVTTMNVIRAANRLGTPPSYRPQTVHGMGKPDSVRSGMARARIKELM